MKSNSSTKMNLVVGIVALFIISSVIPIAIGNNVRTSGDETKVRNYNLDIYLYPEYVAKEKYPDLVYYQRDNFNTKKEAEEYSNNDYQNIIPKNGIQKPTQSLDGPMDSPWPMYCHDVRHTGRSPYSTAGNPGIEKWRFDTNDHEVTGSPVIDDEGIIYIGASDLFAVYPNGTEKWRFEISGGIINSAPAVDENGILYVGSEWAMPDCLYAIYKSNGTVKWKYKVGQDICSSPAIGNDGTIYFGSETDYIYALYPNGTLKWKYLTSVAVYSSPAIGNDGTVYCGSHDTYLYAFYPDNGTVKWKYKTGHWIRTSPCIADDGTIYVVSIDGPLHAVYPNGTRKWITDVGAGNSPTIGQDGTIYCGYNKLHAVYPNNGSIKWSFDPGPDRTIQGGTPCNSADGTIYFGTHIGETDGGELIAVNPDGTERWRIMLATDWIMSAPAIGEDGTIYVGSFNDGYHPGSWGYLHAIGPLDPDAPSAPTINGQTSGNVGTEYEYTFKSTSPLGRDVYYYLDWGDGTISDWFGPFESGEIVTVTHKWPSFDRFTIKARAKDTDNLWGPWSTFEVTIPRNKGNSNILSSRFLECFPLLGEFISRIINPQI